MQYILLIYTNETEFKAMSKENMLEMRQEYMTLTEQLKSKGNWLGGAPLEPTSTATTVRVKAGKTLRTDGPFAETREQLAGFYSVEAKDLDEAVAIAAKIPGARLGSVEVRPIRPM